MAIKPLSKKDIASALAEKVGVTKKQASAMLDELASLVYKNAKNTFVLPGIGKIVVANRPA
ncbi:MAG TPA: HU family DNA-binding protein, partial [Verrucomicrobiota bacterium]|nr:HU family DNA-binding protein [Verrucomicrobiota bacterium]